MVMYSIPVHSTGTATVVIGVEEDSSSFGEIFQFVGHGVAASVPDVVIEGVDISLVYLIEFKKH